jgi:predicted ArsR family transcriptional regulator
LSAVALVSVVAFLCLLIGRRAEGIRLQIVHLVRQHILEILKGRPGATVAELAEQLDMAPVSVRHHLDILQGDNLIRVERLARTGAVGRPQQVYALTEDANEYFPDNFAALASGLLHQLRDILPPDRFERALRSMAREFAAPELTDCTSPLTNQRMDSIVRFLNDRGYLAHWEECDSASPRGQTDFGEGEDQGEHVLLLHKCNCPYAGIAAQHEELCIMDQALIDQLVGQSCERVQSLASDERCCTYRIVVPAPDIAPASSPDSMPVH